MSLRPDLLAHALDDRRMHLTVMPTEACNFRCTYCYEDFALGRMEERVVLALLRFLDRRLPNTERVDLSWFGGEPLLAADVIRRVLRRAREHAHVELRSDITTNAWKLSRALCEELVDLGISSWQISFDGPKEVHDRRRMRLGGQGTFDRVWRNVTALRAVERDFDVRLRVHADKENLAELPRFLEQCEAAFGGDPRFRLFLRPLSRLGGPNDAAIAVLEDERDAEALACAREEARAGGLAVLEPNFEDAVCHAAWGHSFVVRSNGRLNKCTVALAHPANDVGCLNDDGTLTIDAAKTRPWLRGLASGDALECL
ncbi:MAG: radical SAM protein, partial [Planctomycetes bacterium]|nr:radical SAM protein [Planctomycetota bacterium]